MGFDGEDGQRGDDKYWKQLVGKNASALGFLFSMIFLPHPRHLLFISHHILKYPRILLASGRPVYLYVNLNDRTQASLVIPSLICVL